MLDRTSKRLLKIVSGITCSMLGLHVINKVICKRATKNELLYSSHSSYYNWTQGKVFYTKRGSGPAILLLHNLDTVSSHYEWKLLQDELCDHHTVYTIDFLGCGYSDKPKITYTSYLYVQLINDFISTIIQEKTDVITSGQTMSIAIMSNYMNPTYFNQLILINPTTLNIIRKNANHYCKLLKWGLECPIIGTCIYNIFHNKDFIYKQLNNNVICKTHTPLRRLVDAYSESAHLQGSSANYMFSSIQCGYLNVDIKRVLPNIKTPITLLCGSKVDNVNDIIESYQSYNSSIQYKLINNTKQLPHIEVPKVTVNILINLLDGGKN